LSSPVSWPDGGLWIVASTSGDVDWQVAAAAVAAAANVRVAVLAIGPDQRPGDLLAGRVATWLVAGDGGTDPLSAEDVAGLVRVLRRTHGLVLAAGPGLLMPLGRDDWTLTDLAVALSAPVVVVTGAGPDARNHTTLALGALSGRGVKAAVVAIGADDDDDGLPVAPAGRIPADAADRPDEFAGAAPDWLDPILHATGPRPKADKPPPPQGRTVGGRRVVLVLMAVFLSAVVLACGLAFLNRPASQGEEGWRFETTVQVTAEARAMTPRPVFPVPSAVPRPTRPATAVCPQNRPGVMPARVTAATRRRVDAAWKRIEDWLARHAPASRRALRPPATAARIDRAQRQMSVAFPADLVASLRRHDGVSSMGFDLPPFYNPMAVDAIVADRTVSCEVMANLESAQNGWWDPGFVPFAADGSGGCLLVDQRPGGHGRVGDFDPENSTHFENWPASVTELLEGTARSLETGRPYAGRYRPQVSPGGALDWAIG
jgi:cell wall assembly regulator SMI1